MASDDNHRWGSRVLSGGGIPLTQCLPDRLGDSQTQPFRKAGGKNNKGGNRKWQQSKNPDCEHSGIQLGLDEWWSCARQLIRPRGTHHAGGPERSQSFKTGFPSSGKTAVGITSSGCPLAVSQKFHMFGKASNKKTRTPSLRRWNSRHARSAARSSFETRRGFSSICRAGIS